MPRPAPGVPDSLKPSSPVRAQPGSDRTGLHEHDLALVRRVRTGDGAALDAFLERMDCVRRFLTRKNAAFGSPLSGVELEDVTQSTLLAVWRKIDQYAGTGSLEAWVCRFAFLELMSRLHRQGRLPRRLEDLGDEALPAAASEPRLDPLQGERLYRALERLDAIQAEVIRLKHLEGLTFEEIGRRVDIPANTAKTRYYRGIERLRERLGEEDGA